jgi:hypothetical protein
MTCDNCTNGTTSLGYHGEQALYVDESSLEDLVSNFSQASFPFMTSHWQFISMLFLLFRYRDGMTHVILSKVLSYDVEVTVNSHLSPWDL